MCDDVTKRSVDKLKTLLEGLNYPRRRWSLILWNIQDHFEFGERNSPGLNEINVICIILTLIKSGVIDVIRWPLMHFDTFIHHRVHRKHAELIDWRLFLGTICFLGIDVLTSWKIRTRTWLMYDSCTNRNAFLILNNWCYQLISHYLIIEEIIEKYFENCIWFWVNNIFCLYGTKTYDFVMVLSKTVNLNVVSKLVIYNNQSIWYKVHQIF